VLVLSQLVIAHFVQEAWPLAFNVLVNSAVATAFLLVPATVLGGPDAVNPSPPDALTETADLPPRRRSRRKLTVALAFGASLVVAIFVWQLGYRVIRDTPSGCSPLAGQQLVLLADDKHLQNADNVIPIVRSPVATPAVLAALDGVSGALGAADLIRLNRATQVDGRTFNSVARQFARDKGLDRKSDDPESGAIAVGALTFVESQTIGDLYRIALEAAGYTVSVKVISTSSLALPSLLSGDVDVVPHYLSTFTAYLNDQVTDKDEQAELTGDVPIATSRLRTVAHKAGLTVGEPAGASNQNGFAVTREFADKYHVGSLSELAEHCSDATAVFGGPSACEANVHCLPGLRETYGLTFDERVTVDTGGASTIDAIRRGRVTVGLVFTSDPSLTG
jgi:osmoprotectant transport system substrate-binding protein